MSNGYLEGRQFFKKPMVFFCCWSWTTSDFLNCRQFCCLYLLPEMIRGNLMLGVKNTSVYSLSGWWVTRQFFLGLARGQKCLKACIFSRLLESRTFFIPLLLFWHLRNITNLYRVTKQNLKELSIELACPPCIVGVISQTSVNY